MLFFPNSLKCIPLIFVSSYLINLSPGWNILMWHRFTSSLLVDKMETRGARTFMFVMQLRLWSFVQLWTSWRRCWFWTRTSGSQQPRLLPIRTSLSTTTQTTSLRPSRTTRALRAAIWRLRSGNVCDQATERTHTHTLSKQIAHI